MLAGAILAVTLTGAGCAGRRQADDAAWTPAAIATQAVAPTASAQPTPSPNRTAAATPVPSPDLSAVDGLIKDITNDLGADASAGADEGSTP